MSFTNKNIEGYKHVLEEDVMIQKICDTLMLQYKEWLKKHKIPSVFNCDALLCLNPNLEFKKGLNLYYHNYHLGQMIFQVTNFKIAMMTKSSDLIGNTAIRFRKEIELFEFIQDLMLEEDHPKIILEKVLFALQ
jgi:hypothetical protein